MVTVLRFGQYSVLRHSVSLFCANFIYLRHSSFFLFHRFYLSPRFELFMSILGLSSRSCLFLLYVFGPFLLSVSSLSIKFHSFSKCLHFIIVLLLKNDKNKNKMYFVPFHVTSSIFLIPRTQSFSCFRISELCCYTDIAFC